MTSTNHTTPASRLTRILIAARQPMTLGRENVRATVAFDRQLPLVQRYTVLSVPR
ncbi:MAG TPA: hypothetical protein VFR40_17055 [Lapillicoccus sp.]|nr:hypothetical protein [Lapillicoccus sp.]